MNGSMVPAARDAARAAKEGWGSFLEDVKNAQHCEVEGIQKKTEDCDESLHAVMQHV